MKTNRSEKYLYSSRGFRIFGIGFTRKQQVRTLTFTLKRLLISVTNKIVDMTRSGNLNSLKNNFRTLGA